jgi:seryl-tRNA synthetase
MCGNGVHHSWQAGSRFYYLKNEAALLELALIQFAMHKMVPFSPL